MTDLIALASCGLAFFVVAVSPGPANISNATIAMSRGRKTSLVYGLGLSCGLVFWGLIAASGMGAVLQSSITLLIILKVLGGHYLLWLAWQSGRSALHPAQASATTVSEGHWFWRGLILNMSNPKSVIAWMAALSIGIGPNDGLATVAAATLICIAVGFFNNALYSVLFSMGGMMRAYQKARRWIDGVVAGLFAVAGLGLIKSALSR
ncbi:LysE family transporter [Alisedimentitalea sp. MJ-SS2]|uniref:LysE family translocator n=1 Tax=Aliisedimentitalea sp. MJ-SS2 TaxID=3049795 RepID=UPI0029081AF1|nr:LysE family transporter [Alisedimentitalea sp. MJ-SS2]MDU8927451.1 LysE family transporter [Alisedimentitalea sp. MJ-SS2]